MRKVAAHQKNKSQIKGQVVELIMNIQFANLECCPYEWLKQCQKFGNLLDWKGSVPPSTNIGNDLSCFPWIGTLF